MDSIFTAEFFAGNRRELQRLVGANGPIVVAANGLLQRNGDTGFQFRQDGNFYYLTGVNEPDLLLAINGEQSYLIVPERQLTREIFDGRPDYEQLKRISGADDVVDGATGWRYLKAWVQTSNRVVTLAAAPSYDRRHGLFTNPARSRLINKLRRLKPGIEIIDVRKTLAEMRMVKQPPEVTAIQKAIDITAKGIEAVGGNLSSYKYEYEIEAELSKYFRANGASGHAFSPIVASGKNACTLHNIANNDALDSENLVVVDVGAEVDNYAADITRALALGKPSDRQRQVYDAVLAAQDYAFSLLKPGVDFRAYEIKVGEFLGDQLVKLRLIRAAGDKNAVRKYCPHATSHFLGLDVHDVGDYLQPLKANMVLTVEPGIYIPEEGIGVRIEDDVIITEGGNRILSRDLPRELMLN